MNEKNESTTASSNSPVTVSQTTTGLQKYIHFTYFFGAVVAAWLLFKVLDSIWTTLNLNFTVVPAPQQWVVMAVSVIAAAVTAFYLWREPRLNRLIGEIVSELSKVTWPTRKETSVSTVVVLITSVIASIILGLFDYFWSFVTDLIFQRGQF